MIRKFFFSLKTARTDTDAFKRLVQKPVAFQQGSASPEDSLPLACV